MLLHSSLPRAYVLKMYPLSKDVCQLGGSAHIETLSAKFTEGTIDRHSPQLTFFPIAKASRNKEIRNNYKNITINAIGIGTKFNTPI